MQWISEAREQPVEQAIATANKMHYYKPEDVLGLELEFQPDTIRQTLSKMSLDSLRYPTATS